jgi:hypothetical protein
LLTECIFPHTNHIKTLAVTLKVWGSAFGALFLMFLALFKKISINV